MPGAIGVYGVSAVDIAAELPGLFPNGFTQVTKPSMSIVEGWIADADAYIDSVISSLVTTTPPTLVDQVLGAATRLAKRYVIGDVVARIYRAIYAGKASPADIANLSTEAGGKTVLDQITSLTTQIIIANEQAQEVAGQLESRVRVSPSAAPRDLLIDDIDLDPHFGGGRF